jgi:hypothetical protein
MYHIYIFAHVEPLWYLRDESQSIMLKDIFNVLLNTVFKDFVENMFLNYLFIYLFTCVYLVRAISPPAPAPSLSPHPPYFHLPSSPILLKRRHKQ